MESNATKASRRSKAKGRRGENLAVLWLQAHFPKAERRRLRGNKDAGDVANCDPFVVEVKNAERWDVHGWLQELHVEMEAGGTTLGFVMAKRNGGAWTFIVPDETMNALLLGHGRL